MKVDNPNTQLIQLSGIKDRDTRDSATQSTKPLSVTPGDKATLTSTTTMLQQFEAEIAAQPIIDTHHVERVQDAIKNDHFQIDPAIVAKKLFNLETALHHAQA